MYYDGETRVVNQTGVCCVKSYVSKRTHRWVRIVGVGNFLHNTPQIYNNPIGL